MTTTHELARAIDPRKKPCFSPNLHKWVKHWVKDYPENMLPEVWLKNDGIQLLYIGRQTREENEIQACGFVGVRLNSVLRNGVSANKERGWFTNLGPGNMTHVADFWDRYLQIGRCAIDAEHRQFFIGDEGRYVMHGKIRTCTWCGAQHKLRIEKKVTTRLIEHYDPITPKEAA